MDVLDTATGAVVEGGVDRLLNMVFDTGAHAYGKALVALKIAFKRYLENAIRDKNTIRTIATGDEDHPRHIRGENPLYVPIGLEFQKKEYDTTDIASLLAISNHLLVVGSGGMGKSMLMRYLFLKTAEGDQFIPILLDLNRFRQLDLNRFRQRETSEDGKDEKDDAISALLYSCMADYDIMLPKKEFKDTLRAGKYLLLLDGFDEIPEIMAKQAAYAIEKFCSKYPNNPCIVTSRQRPESFIHLTHFSTLHSMPLKKWQAVELAKRIWAKSERTEEFGKQLNESLYEKHQSFAENPLLLNMMFLTFMHNQSIPDHLCDFYQRAYDALYNVHDNRDKSGEYRREFACKTLDEKQFQHLFSRFCFQTYFSNQFEFSRDDLLYCLTQNIEKLRKESSSFPFIVANDYLADLQNNVCMIIRDGNTFRFSHRSFQTYFAALYTSKKKASEQKEWFSWLFFNEDGFYRLEYFDLLYQIAPDNFISYALEEGLRDLQEKANASNNPDLFFLKAQYSAIKRVSRHPKIISLVSANSSKRTHNLLLFFELYITRKKHYPLAANDLHARVFDYTVGITSRQFFVDFSEIDESPYLTNVQRKRVYSDLINLQGIPHLRADIQKWLDEQDAKHMILEKARTLKEVIDAF